MKHKSINLDNKNWAANASSIVLNEIKLVLTEKGSCNFLLTGGVTAKDVYLEMGSDAEFKNLKGINFYFGDERCIPPYHPDSNYGMAIKALFGDAKDLGNHKIYPLYINEVDIWKAARSYEELLPEKIDILLLSMAADGHIASLFPNSPVLTEMEKRVVPVYDENYPYKRITITPKVILETSTVFILCRGKEKKWVFKKLNDNPRDYSSIPARLVINGIWLV